MFFKYRTTAPPLPDLYYGLNILTWVNSFKYIGMIVVNKLIFILQVSQIQNKLSRRVGILRRLR